MHLCSYCKCEFIPRKQVKNPVACLKLDCQKKRQRHNERMWHEKQRDKFDCRYHRFRRKQRAATILNMITKIVHAAKIGFTLTAQGFDAELFQSFLQRALSVCGLRYANKLWKAETS